MNQRCPFCEITLNDSENRILFSSEHGFAIRDGYPITAGHTLIIPFRHVGSFFDLTDQEQLNLLQLAAIARAQLQKEYGIKDLNIGINDGPLAGQTVAHCHIHLIPRRVGDVADPRGGVRWVIPEKANYWD